MKISLLMKSLNSIDNTIVRCPNIHVFGLTPEGEEITQPCPTGQGFFLENAPSAPANLGIVRTQRGLHSTMLSLKKKALDGSQKCRSTFGSDALEVTQEQLSLAACFR